MKYVLKFFLLNALVVLFGISHAQSNIVESKFIEVLEGVCLLNKDDFTHIDKIATALKLKAIPNDLLQGDMVIASRGGKGYIVEEAGQKFIVGYAVGGGCSVASQTINLDELKKKLLSVYKLKLMQTNDEGMQITEFYRFDADSSYSGDYLTITYSREKDEQDIVSVSYLPEKVYLKEKNSLHNN